MSSPVRCQSCGKAIPAEAERCPACGRARPEGELRPLGGPAPAPPSRQPRLPSTPDDLYRVEPLPPAPGQEAPGSWAYVTGIMRADKLFAAVLVLMALVALMNLAGGSILGAAIAGAILWGVLTLQWWGYLLAMALSTVNLVVMVMALLTVAFRNPKAAMAGSVALSVPLAITVFVMVVLYTRRQHFA